MIVHLYLCTEHKRLMLTAFKGFRPVLTVHALSIHGDTATGGKCEADGCMQDPGFVVDLSM